MKQATIIVVLLFVLFIVSDSYCRSERRRSRRATNALADSRPAVTMTTTCEKAIQNNRLHGATVYENPRYMGFLQSPCRNKGTPGFLTKEEIALIHAYTNFEHSSNIFIALNCFLRYRGSVEVPGWVYDFTARLSQVIDKLGEYNDVVWRGTALHTKPQMGQVIENLSFLSTSSDRRAAQTFAGGQYLLAFYNHGGASVAQYSCMDNEKEVIVKPNQCWKVFNIEEGKPTIIHLEQVSCKGKSTEALLSDRFVVHG